MAGRLALVVETFFTSIFPIVSFAFETFLPNPGDYSFLYRYAEDHHDNGKNTGFAGILGVHGHILCGGWVTRDNNAGALYGQPGILFNKTIWHAFGGTLLVAVCCALVAGTIGTLIGYAVSKNRRSKSSVVDKMNPCVQRSKNSDSSAEVFYLGNRKLGPLVAAMSAEASDKPTITSAPKSMAR